MSTLEETLSRNWTVLVLFAILLWPKSSLRCSEPKLSCWLKQNHTKCGINPKTQCTNQCNAELFLKTLAKLKHVFEKHHLHPVSGKYGDNKWKKQAILFTPELIGQCWRSDRILNFCGTYTRGRKKKGWEGGFKIGCTKLSAPTHPPLEM